MSRSYKFTPDGANEERKRADRRKREARKEAQFYTPAPVRETRTRPTRHA